MGKMLLNLNSFGCFFGNKNIWTKLQESTIPSICYTKHLISQASAWEVEIWKKNFFLKKSFRLANLIFLSNNNGTRIIKDRKREEEAVDIKRKGGGWYKENAQKRCEMSEVMIHLIECIRCLCGEQQQYYPTLNQCLIWKYQWKKVSNAIKPRRTKQFRVVFVLFCLSLCKVNNSIQVQCASAPYRLCCTKATHITENGTHCFAHEAIESFYFA